MRAVDHITGGIRAGIHPRWPGVLSWYFTHIKTHDRRWSWTVTGSFSAAA